MLTEKCTEIVLIVYAFLRRFDKDSHKNKLPYCYRHHKNENIFQKR